MSSYGDITSKDQYADMTFQTMSQVGFETGQELYAETLTAQKEFRTDLEEMINPFAKKVQQKEKPRSEQLSRISKLLKQGEKSDRLEQMRFLERHAQEFEKRNPELKAKVLLLIREQIKPGDTKEQIIKKIFDFYPDVTLVDDVLDFLLETTAGELNKEVQESKEELNETYSREIIAGRNISTIAQQSQSLGSPTSLRDLYRDITGTPRDTTTLFDELARLYPFKELKKVLKFLFHSIGNDMKSKGPSIPRGQLHNLLQETRTLQAILGVYRFFAGRSRLISSMFAKEGLKPPEKLNFEMLAKNFMNLCAERYPSADKVLKLAKSMGLDKWTIAQIIILSQMRDAVREVAMNQIFRSLQHRDELYAAIIEALEDLEDAWQEEEDQRDEDEEDDNEGYDEGEIEL
jgi:type III secretion protein W